MIVVSPTSISNGNGQGNGHSSGIYFCIWHTVGIFVFF